MIDELVLQVPTREAIERLEAEVLKLPQVDLRTTHVLSGGLYARTMFVPAGAVCIGALHKKDHVNVMHGDASFWSDGVMTRVSGFQVLAGVAGSKRAIVAHADTWWTTMLRTDLIDIEEIETEATDEHQKLQSRQQRIEEVKSWHLE